MSQQNEQPTVEHEQRQPFQFTLGQLMIFTSWWISICVIGKCFGWGLGVLMAMLSLICAGLSVRRTRLLALAAVPLFLVVLFWPGSQRINPRRRRPTCAGNLQQIGLALENYHQRYGCFPPAYLTDKSGKPTHSWRVLILPYLGEHARYSLYDFNEPWNGPNNRKLGDGCPDVFRCPADAENASTATNYFAVIGPRTAWPGSESTKHEDFSDGLGSTILLVEVAGADVHWMQPRDLHVQEMIPQSNSKAVAAVSSRHPGEVNVLFADVSIRFLPDGLSPKTLRALLTRDGAEAIDATGF